MLVGVLDRCNLLSLDLGVAKTDLRVRKIPGEGTSHIKSTGVGCSSEILKRTPK